MTKSNYSAGNIQIMRQMLAKSRTGAERILIHEHRKHRWSAAVAHKVNGYDEKASS